jgi:hypothetical protein
MGKKETQYFNLEDYKGKFNIIRDVLEDYSLSVGAITKEEAINQAEYRKEKALYYGVPAYIGKDKDLNKIYN